MDEASRLPVDERWIELHGIMEHGKLIITIRNPGHVIPEEHIQRIFLAGYSTKDLAKHNGIGLSIVKERVNYYNGEIIVTSSENNGTEFRVEIPNSQI
ncbi:MAG: ATP-binding protein [Paenibacillaceae bacterium]